MVDQLLEALSGLFMMSARLCAERATDEQRIAIYALLDRMTIEQLDVNERVLLARELGDRFVEASDNLVLQIIRRGMKTQFMDRFAGTQVAAPSTIRIPHLQRLRRALEERDGTAASESIFELTRAIRAHALDGITAERNLRAAAGGQGK